MNNSEQPSEKQESFGRIEVAPEVIAIIAYNATIGVEGVAKTVNGSSPRFRRGARAIKHEGVVLSYEGNDLTLDIHIWIQHGASMVETSRAVQKSVVEALDHMVGIPVQGVNIHVENVSPSIIQPAENE